MNLIFLILEDFFFQSSGCACSTQRTAPASKGFLWGGGWGGWGGSSGTSSGSTLVLTKQFPSLSLRSCYSLKLHLSKPLEPNLRGEVSRLWGRDWNLIVCGAQPEDSMAGAYLPDSQWMLGGLHGCTALHRARLQHPMALLGQGHWAEGLGNAPWLLVDTCELLKKNGYDYGCVTQYLRFPPSNSANDPSRNVCYIFSKHQLWFWKPVMWYFETELFPLMFKTHQRLTHWEEHNQKNLTDPPPNSWRITNTSDLL